jgi:hypothetical protein
MTGIFNTLVKSLKGPEWVHFQTLMTRFLYNVQFESHGDVGYLSKELLKFTGEEKGELTDPMYAPFFKVVWSLGCALQNLYKKWMDMTKSLQRCFVEFKDDSKLGRLVTKMSDEFDKLVSDLAKSSHPDYRSFMKLFDTKFPVSGVSFYAKTPEEAYGNLAEALRTYADILESEFAPDYMPFFELVRKLATALQNQYNEYEEAVYRSRHPPRRENPWTVVRNKKREKEGWVLVKRGKWGKRGKRGKRG